MKMSILALAALTGLSACGVGVSNTGAFQEPAFERQGELQCAPGTTSNDALRVGTAASPLRCGPQSQALPG